MTLLNTIFPDQRRGKLKSLLEDGKTVRVLEAHNGLSGIIANTVEVTGDSDGQTVIRQFDAIWESSLTDSASKGHPDIEVVTFDSRFHTINEILTVTDKPMIVDGDTGGDANTFEYTVSKLERAGVSAVIIEDKINLKRNSLGDIPQEQDTIDGFCKKISVGKQSQVTEDFMIIARIESFIQNAGLEDAIKRAKSYIDAGADGIMIHSKKKNADEIRAFCEEFSKFERKVPLVAVPTTYNTIYEKELEEMGVNLVIYANHMLRSAYPTMVNTANTILKHGRLFEVEKNCLPINEFINLIPEK